MDTQVRPPMPQNLMTQDSRDALNQNIQMMMIYAATTGIALPESLKEKVDVQNDADVIAAHNVLVEAVKPATPQGIQYIYAGVKQTNSRWGVKKGPFERKLIFLSWVALLVLVLVSLSPNVNEQTVSAGLLASSGVTLLLNILFIFSASLLGVMFSLLKQIATSMEKMNLSPHVIFNINIEVLMGCMSGFVLSELIPLDGEAFKNIQEICKMTLALLGGFSARVVYAVLQSALDKIQQLFVGTSG